MAAVRVSMLIAARERELRIQDPCVTASRIRDQTIAGRYDPRDLISAVKTLLLSARLQLCIRPLAVAKRWLRLLWPDVGSRRAHGPVLRIRANQPSFSAAKRVRMGPRSRSQATQKTTERLKAGP